jgi:large subunit ribosomal protein L35
MPSLLFKILFKIPKIGNIMPKLKTKSAVKKRFKITASGKVKASQAGKKHFMRRRTKAQLRNLRGTTILCSQDAKNIIKYFLPYGTN